MVKLGELFCRAATAGIQVVIETHSDHVLNGIRLSVKEGQARPGDVALYHSKWQPGGKSPFLIPIEIDKNGRLNTWPEGFFDEIERSLDQLLGVE